MRIHYAKLRNMTHALSLSVLMLSKELTFLFPFTTSRQFYKASTKILSPDFTSPALGL